MKFKHFPLACFSLSVLFISCNNNQETSNDQAYQNYKVFVTETEQDTAGTIDQLEIDSAWYMRTSTLQEKYDSLHNQVNITLDELSAEQQEEVKDLDNRFRTAHTQIAQKQAEISKRYKMREDLLRLKVQADDMTAITEANLAPTYKHFVEQVKANYKTYTYEEWQLIEGWWNALNNRAGQLTNELTAEAKSETEAARKEFIRIRKEADMTQPGT